jgi:hypothetical protein
MAVSAVYSEGLIEFPPRAGTLTFGAKPETDSRIIERLRTLSNKAVIVLSVFYKRLDDVMGAKVTAPPVQLRLLLRLQT